MQGVLNGTLSNIQLTSSSRFGDAYVSRAWLIEDEWRMYASVNYNVIGSDNGLPPDRRQAVIWTNAGILLIGPLATNFSEILIEIHIFLF